MATPTTPVIVPPFTEATARRKVQLAEDAWNTRDGGGQWWRSHGNEHWEFDEASGLMRRRDASINDYRIDASERRIALP